MADRLGVSQRYVRYLAAAGHLPKIKLGARSARYRLVDVETLIAAREEQRGESPTVTVDRGVWDRVRDGGSQ